VSFRELDQRATRLANCWRAHGIGAGDHVGLQLYNGSEYLEGMLAAYKLRAVPININYHYVAEELQYLYNDADLVAVVTHQAFAPDVAAVTGFAGKLQHVFCVADDSGAAIDAGFHDYEEALANSSELRDFAPRDSDDIYIVYTGGTTGMPKGVMWHHRDIFFGAMGGGDLDQSQGPINDPGELVGRIGDMAPAALPAPPFMHAAAQWSAFSLLFAGGKIVIPARGRFEPTAIWQSVDDEAVNLLIIVGDAMATPLADALEASPRRWSAAGLLAIASGGVLFSPATKDRLISLLPNCFIVDGLGSSETGVMGNKISAGEAGEREPRFIVNESTIVLDDDNQKVEPGSGVVGQIARRGHVPIGYYNAPEKSATTFIEVDGERVVAVCQTRSGSTLELETLREFCRGKLASYKIPRTVVCLEKIKRSPAGKANYPWAKEAARDAA
jgi:acyl-CoA synthetase (AMP-forming)/AMP-acid ligase II